MLQLLAHRTWHRYFRQIRGLVHKFHTFSGRVYKHLRLLYIVLSEGASRNHTIDIILHNNGWKLFLWVKNVLIINSFSSIVMRFVIAGGLIYNLEEETIFLAKLWPKLIWNWPSSYGVLHKRSHSRQLYTLTHRILESLIIGVWPIFVLLLNGICVMEMFLMGKTF